MCGRGNVHGRGCVWQGVCVWQGTCVAGACMAGGGMHGRGACVTGGVHGTHAPSRRYYEIRSMSGRYASYWNAFLFSFISTGTKTYLSTPTHSFETHVYLHWDRCPCFGFRTYVLVSLLPPANIACEGYVFTCVFQSLCSQLGGGMHAMCAPCHACPTTLHAPYHACPLCHACPLPCMPPTTHAPCHTCPPTTHAPLPHMPPPPAMHIPYHACPPPAMHAPYHTCPPAMHAPPPHMSPPTLRHAVNERAVCILLECILVYLLVLIVYLLMIPQKRQLFYVIVN